MKRPNPTLVVTVVVLSLILNSRVNAALAPSTIKKKKDAASDVLEVRITGAKVKSTGYKGTYFRSELEYEAKVIGVVRAKSGTQVGDRISISSYRLKGLLPPGPRNPPLLDKGWQGTIYLNKLSGEMRFGIAVFGHSFEPRSQNTTIRKADRK